MKTRLISAVIALPLVFGLVYLGGIYTYILVLGAVIIGLDEFNKAFDNHDKFIYYIQILATLIHFFIISSGLYEYLFGAGILLFVLLFMSYVLRYPKLELSRVITGLVGYYYITIMMSHILMVRNVDEYGFALIWLVLIIAFGSDTFAYFAGKAFGKKKLAPLLSPNKTIAGALGGILGSGLATALYANLVISQVGNLTTGQLIGFAFMGVTGSVFSQFGDMAASAMKRVAGIKDFGHVIPGHGGIVDRLDSIIFVAPFVYYASMMILSFS